MAKNKSLSYFVTDKPSWHKYSKSIWIMGIVFLLACMFMPWMQTVEGHGRVIALNPEGRRQELMAPIEGRIQKWYVQEGQKVKKGEPVVELSDNDPMIIDRMNKERDALEKKFEAIELGRKTAYLNVKRQKELFKEGISSRRQLEQSQMELAKLESDEASALADLSRFDVRLSRQEQQMISAPMDGIVVRILKTSSGGIEYVKAGEPLAIIVPEETADRAVELWVSGNDMPWIYEKHLVALNFEGWPSIFFSGVPNASVGTFFGRVVNIDALDDGQGNFRIIVVPDKGEWPDSRYLRQGVRVNSWVLLGDVPLGFEIWRRFNGFPPSNLPIYKKADSKEDKKG
jgi:biotin carboxyl carrier protein